MADIKDKIVSLESLKYVQDSLQTQVDDKVSKDGNKVLSTNDFTDSYKDQIEEAFTHTDDTSNPHNVSLSQLGVTATAEELNYISGATSSVQAQLNQKADDFSIELYNGTSGNPNPVRFMTVNYTTCGSENGVAIKISMVSGHGNGTSYAFLQDAIIRVSHTGTVEVDNFKHYGASTGNYDGADRQYGDIFWVVDTTNKVVDFYCLMGQYARVQMTPYKRVTYSTGGAITQYKNCTVYSSGDKAWANNSEYAVLDDLVGYLPLAGGAITGVIDASGTSNVLDFGVTGWIRGQTSSGGKFDIFGYSTPTELQIGGSYPALAFKGKNARPTYNGADMALQSDISENCYTKSEIDTAVGALENRLTALEESVVTLHSGATVPANELGENGDVYLVTEA